MSTLEVTTPQAWVPLAKLSAQFAANLAALRKANPALAQRVQNLNPGGEYFIRTEAESVILARRTGGTDGADVTPNILPASKAREIVATVFPDGRYSQPVAVAGLDQGWLWDALYKLPSACAHAPGMRFPLYLLAGSVERLWAVMHYQNWTNMLADPRVRIFVGENAAAELQEMLINEPRLCPPRRGVTVEPALLQAGQTLDSLINAVAMATAARLMDLQRSLDALPAPTPIGSGPLRVLGVTSRYTTFLQHSMRDWLAAMEKLGHQTRLLIEGADHEIMPGICVAEECLAFRPDLIVVIDHYRAELAGLRRIVPCVMWVQDRLPHIYHPNAGLGQDEHDFVIGYGRQECTQKWGYPSKKFMPSMVGVNEERFLPRELTRAEQAEFGCDVSFVSHASVSAQRIVEEESERANNPLTRKLLSNIYERLRAIYDTGASVTSSFELTAIIDEALVETNLKGDAQALMDLVSQRINNAFFRHQAIRWVAQQGVDLRLYGRGWEDNPEFKKYARGIACNQNQLSTIYQASRVNLQVTPFGAAHQRSFEGIACGGFFLLRSVTGDAFDTLQREAWRWCWREGVSSAEEMVKLAERDAGFAWILSGLTNLLGTNPLSDPEWFYSGLEEAALAGFSRSASTLWPEYPQVSFWSESELTEKLRYFLAHPRDRREISTLMRERVLQWHTYTAISKRMLAFIGENYAARTAARQPAIEQPLAQAA